MAFELTTTAKLLSEQTNIGQQIIVEIDGIDLIFGAVQITKIAKYGEDSIKFGDPGLVYGGVVADENGRDYLSLDGTTSNITQQLEVDKGGVGSVQKFNVVLVDKDQELTRLFQPGNVVADLLSREANVYLNFQGGAHPDDSVRIFNGIITGQEASPGAWRLRIDHPEFLKRQDIYEQINTLLSGSLSAGATSVSVDSTAGVIAPADVSMTYLLVDEELMEVSSIDTITSFTVARGALGTVASTHDDDAQVTTFYTLSGPALELALKLMLSNSGNVAFSTANAVTRFEKVTDSLTIANSFLADTRIKDGLGLELGDLVTITGAVNGANNITDAPIAAFQDDPTGTIIVVSGVSMVEETGSTAVASFKSQWNVLPNGAGMKPSQVDVAQHLELRDFFATGLPDYTLYIKDTISPLKDFLTNEIYKPQGFYQAPRKGRASVNITQPPLVLEELVELTESNTIRANKNIIRRQITKNFYNNIVYKFNVDTLTDKFQAGEVIFSQRSLNRIDTGNKTLRIESTGLRDDAATRNFIKSQARRFSDRYEFAPESITVQTDYKTGFNIEVSDVVLFGVNGLQIPDINNGTREFEPRLMEVVNKTMNLKGGDAPVKLELLDTGFGVTDGRFGVVSPNSYTASGSTTTSIRVKQSFATTDFENERDKWTNFIGQEIRVRNEDYTFDETVKIIEFQAGNSNGITIDPPLSLAPPEDYLVDLPDYDTVLNDDQTKMKQIHGFMNPFVTVISATSDTSFTVSLADAAILFVDSFIRAHNADFTDNSTPGIVDDDVQVLTVDTGTGVVTTSASLGFTPTSGDIVDLIGFKIDSGSPFRYI